MNTLFNKNKLTKEQQGRWDWAVCKYREIREQNTLHSFEELNEEEKLHLMQELTEAKEFKGALTVDMLDEKSALFARLLDGKNPLIYPPPCAYSYPWYEVIEENGPWNLSIEAADLKELIWENLHGESQILIEQTPWKIIDKKSDNEVVVTFGKWESLNFKWVLKKVQKSCAQTKSFIYCHHKPSVSRITTVEELRNEQLYHINKEFDKVKLVLDEEFAHNYKKSLCDKYGDNNMTATILLSEIQLGKDIINERQLLKLSQYPSHVEIDYMVNEKVKEYFTSGYSHDEEGNLFVQVWVLEKMQGNVEESIYINIE